MASSERLVNVQARIRIRRRFTDANIVSSRGIEHTHTQQTNSIERKLSRLATHQIAQH